MFGWLGKNKEQSPQGGRSPAARPNPRPNMRPPQQRARPPQQQAPLRPPPKSVSGVTVYFDDQFIRCVKANGDVESLRWEDLAGVMIMVSADGPYSKDMQWIMAGRKEGGCLFPNTAAGAAEIIRHMQDNLNGFNNSEVIKAMDCKENAKFLIWKSETSAK